MSVLSPRLTLGVAQKQILTPGLVQMVTVLQLNRLELKEMILQEIALNPVLEEATEVSDELTPDELQALLETERHDSPADQPILDALRGDEGTAPEEASEAAEPDVPAPTALLDSSEPDAVAASDPFDEIDFGSFFEEYLDPGFKTPTAENPDKPSFETFLSAPVTLADHLQQQLSMEILDPAVRDATDAIIGNLDDNGYLNQPLEEIAEQSGHPVEVVQQALTVVQSLDPAGIAARDMRECLLLQIEAANGRGGVAWQIVDQHLKLLELRNFRELARLLGRPMEHIQLALAMIRRLDPRPGLRFTSPAARPVEPDVYIVKQGDDYIIQLNDDDIPQLRLNGQYRRMLDREQEPNKEVRHYIKERYASALQLIKNIEQRKQTILKVCQSIVRRQREFLESGIDHLRPMMIKEVAEEIGVHPSTVSRAVAGKYAHTPQGVFELRFFFSEAVQGPSGAVTPLLLLKRRVKKMIEEEDPRHPLTDEQITERLRAEGIQVTRRTVAKYREDMKIPSTHQRRRRD